MGETTISQLTSPNQKRQDAIDMFAAELVDPRRINTENNKFNEKIVAAVARQQGVFLAEAMNWWKKDHPDEVIPDSQADFLKKEIVWEDRKKQTWKTTVGEFIEIKKARAELLERKERFEQHAEGLRNEDPPNFADTFKSGFSSMISGITDGLFKGDFNVAGHIFGGIKQIVTGMVMQIPFIGKPIRQAATGLGLIFTDWDRVKEKFNGGGTFFQKVGAVWDMAGRRAETNDIAARAYREAGKDWIGEKDLWRMVRDANEGLKPRVTGIQNVLRYLDKDIGGEAAKLYDAPAGAGPKLQPDESKRYTPPVKLAAPASPAKPPVVATEEKPAVTPPAAPDRGMVPPPVNVPSSPSGAPFGSPSTPAGPPIPIGPNLP